MPTTASAAPRSWLWPAALLLLTLLLYLPAMQGEFVVDDVPVVRDNPHIRNWDGVGRFFTRSTWANTALEAEGVPVYRPLLLLALTAQHALWGDSPSGYHAFALAVHLLATLLLYLAARRLAAATPAVAAGAAALFAWHPARVESVAWISGVNDPMAAVFLLAALLAHRRLVEGGSRLWLAAALACFAGALGSKEAAIALPLVLIAHDLLWLRRVHWLSLASHAVLAAAYLALRASVLAKAESGLAVGLAGLGRALDFLVGYGELLAFPTGVPFHLVPPEGAVASAQGMVSALALLLLLGYALWRATDGERRALLLGLAWFAAFFWPALLLAFYKEGYFSARHLYVPAAGVALCAAVLLRQLGAAWPRLRPLGAAGLAALLAGHAVVTTAEIPDWRSEAAIYGEVIALAPGSAAGYIGLGRHHFERENYAAAQQQLTAALLRARTAVDRIYPLVTLGTIAGMAQDIAAAEIYFNEAVQTEPNNADAWAGLGNLAWMRGKTDDAVFYYEKALALRPRNYEAAMNLAMAYDKQGQGEKARQLRTRVSGTVPRGTR